MSVLELEALLYQLLLRHTGLAVYNHVPDDAIAPFIRIGDISARPWLLTPPSTEVSLVIAAFSEEQSNQKVIEIASSIKAVLSGHLTRRASPSIIQANILATRIFQLKNLTWCAEIEFVVHHYTNEEPKCTTQK